MDPTRDRPGSLEHDGARPADGAGTLAVEGGNGPREPMLTRPFRIQRVTEETADTFTWRLVPERRGDAFPFEPGQFNMLYAFPVGEAPISISGDPGRPDVLVHTTRAVGTVSRAMRALKRGDVIGVRGPYGTPWPVDDARGGDLLLMPGGIGIAPLRPVLYHALAHRDTYRRVILLYGARTPADILYAGELEAWRGRSDLEMQVTVDRASGDWRGRVGLVTALIPHAGLDPARTTAMICGPEVMMRFAARELETAGLPRERIYISMERSMKCGIGFCGHCMFGPVFVCKEGPVFRLDRVSRFLSIAEV